jgi:hypothetical protein
MKGNFTQFKRDPKSTMETASNFDLERAIKCLETRAMKKV